MLDFKSSCPILHKNLLFVQGQFKVFVSPLGSRQSQRRVLVGCSTGLCSTIEIKQLLIDDMKSWDV
jgi:hypothetical protein